MAMAPPSRNLFQVLIANLLVISILIKAIVFELIENHSTNVHKISSFDCFWSVLILSSLHL
jgi:hypothetical protein